MKDVSVVLIKSILRSILDNCQIESRQILKSIGDYLNCKSWVASDNFNKLCAERNSVVFEKSISFLFPDLAKEWHPTKNEPLLPEHFTPGPEKIAWWRNHFGLEWEEKIKYRVRKVETVK